MEVKDLLEKEVIEWKEGKLEVSEEFEEDVRALTTVEIEEMGDILTNALKQMTRISLYLDFVGVGQMINLVKTIRLSHTFTDDLFPLPNSNFLMIVSAMGGILGYDSDEIEKIIALLSKGCDGC